MAANDLWELANTVLDVAELALDTLPAVTPHAEYGTLLGAPSRRFVAPGLPQFECCAGEVPGQLSVHVQSLGERAAGPIDPSGRGRLSVGRINASLLMLVVLRCVKQFGANGRGKPSVGDQNRDGWQALHDGWAVWNGLWRAQKEDGALADLCSGVVFRDASTLVPAGGCGGWVVAISPDMQGYDPFA